MATPEEIALQAQVALLQERIDNYEATLKETRKFLAAQERKAALYDLLTPSEQLTVDQREAANLAKAQENVEKLSLIEFATEKELLDMAARKEAAEGR